MKQQLSIYLEPDQLRALNAYADRHKVSKSVVAEAAIASFLSPDTAERQEAAIARRLDRLTRQLQRCERDIGISVETIALLVRFGLISTPVLPEASQVAARAKGLECGEGLRLRGCPWDALPPQSPRRIRRVGSRSPLASHLRSDYAIFDN